MSISPTPTHASTVVWLGEESRWPRWTSCIAATALTHGAALLTANEAHFASVSGLRVLGYR